MSRARALRRRADCRRTTSSPTASRMRCSRRSTRPDESLISTLRKRIEAARLKITQIETFKYWIDWCNWLFVRVSTDEGLVGWGEGSLHGAIESVETAIHEYAPHLVGHDPAGPERHWHRLYHAWRWRGGAAFQTALAALDIALWDLEGKRLGVPIA